MAETVAVDKTRKNMAYCYITVGEEKILWAEANLKTGEVKTFLPQEEIEAYQAKMMENVGRNMSRYIENHPESALWKKTN